MNKKINTIILLTTIVAILAVIVAGSRLSSSPQGKNTSQTNQPTSSEETADIFYWGTTCPHCHETIEWMEENKIEEKLKIVRKEVYQNQANSQELSVKAQSCGLPAGSVGVPLMYTTDGQCLIGTPDITSYLKEAVEEKAKNNEASPAATKE